MRSFLAAAGLIGMSNPAIFDDSSGYSGFTQGTDVHGVYSGRRVPNRFNLWDEREMPK